MDWGAVAAEGAVTLVCAAFTSGRLTQKVRELEKDRDDHETRIRAGEAVDGNLQGRVGRLEEVTPFGRSVVRHHG